MSNTSKMSAGAAHGAGIYLAPELQTSVGYMVKYSSFNNRDVNKIHGRTQSMVLFV